VTESLYAHTVIVETLVGANAEWGGSAFASPVVISCLIAEQTKLVRSSDGNDAISGTQILASPTDGARLLPGSRVTLPIAPHRPAERVTTVITLDSLVVGDPDVDGVTAMCE
jgi:hypothetical protein